ncbi:hypothetical protein GYMLUDRAFT_49340 [Collybiopsis luxurians FD-317 M1]|uniref:F-box domain-containing protein n=1 Tax=Collybiopsis luxurians FD-317 M1 TaxID=944289 RepID=A0A0D0BF74_9AGAR|nr:hypothetical protein GYMLUDRAFT_49340 [Collybiopsis luxurians FD-317 M1]
MAHSTSTADKLCWRCKNPIPPARVNINASELHTKLRSQYGPSMLTAQEVDEIVKSCERDLEDYETEVVQLQSQILLLQQKRQHIKTYMTNARSLLSPVRRVPNEILGVIFEYACNQNLIQEFPWSLDDNPPPTELTSPAISFLPALSISSTCSRWHSIAKSSNLWSNLRLEVTTKFPGLLDPTMNIIQMFLTRSAERLLDIHLTISGDPQNHISPVFDLLLQHSVRWKVFKFQGWNSAVRPCMISKHLEYDPTRDFPNLEILEIANVCPEELDVFRNAPKLRKLRHWFMMPAHLPLAQLTHITCYAAFGGLDDLFDFCPNVVSLELSSLQRSPGHSFQSVTPKTSYRVTSLTLLDDCVKTDRTLDLALLNLTLPALKELRVERKLSWQGHNARWPKDIFFSFLSRSSCKLTKLTISSIGISDTDLIPALQLLSSLVSLEINDYEASPNISPITSRFIRSLEFSGSNSTLIPKLRCLSLDYSGYGFDDLGFISMVSSRWLLDPRYAKMVGVECLRSVEMRFRQREVNGALYKPLQLLDKMGLRVTVLGKNNTKI